ncbi:MAG: Hpt domain-containing protein [Planctomycetota bacterium]
MADNDEFLNEFLIETGEHLEQAEASLLNLSHDPDDRESMDACFRSLHTIKGGAGFLGLSAIQHLAHNAEQLLEGLCGGSLACTGDRVDVLLVALSHLRRHVEVLTDGTTQAADDADQDVIQRLQDLTSTTSSPDPTRQAASGATDDADPAGPQGILTAIVALSPEDIPALIQHLDRLEGMAGGDGHLAEHAEDVARMAQICNEVMFGDADAIAAGMGRIQGVAEGLLQHLAGCKSEAQQTELEPNTHSLANDNPITALRQKQSLHGNDAAVGDYLAELTEILDQVEQVMLGVDDARRFESEQVGTVFRGIHTIKGMSAYIGFSRVEHLAHLLEGELLPIRDGSAVWTETLASLLMDGIDCLRVVANCIRRDRGDDGPWPQPAIAYLIRLGWDKDLPEQAGHHEDGNAVPRIGDLLEEEGVDRATIEEAVRQPPTGRAQRLGDRLVESGKATPEQVTNAVRKQGSIRQTLQRDASTRVNIARLDELVNLVGELLIAQSMVAQDATQSEVPRLQQSVGRMSRIVRDLQALSLSLRMVPLKSTFQKMARAVHDTARKLGKEIGFSMTGEETEIDRTLAEMLADPLLHMVRNAVDHGIEERQERLAAGKPAKGQVQLSAEQTSDNVVIRLQDDGAGMDPDRLRRKGIEKGLISPDQQLTEHEAYKLIFRPGFSTAAAVTGISGRGVGMDVASRNIHALGGNIEIDSSLGRGTSFTIRLPLTTAILEAMLLRVGTHRYLIPITAIIEAIKPQEQQIQQVMGAGTVVKSRNKLLPLVSLQEIFGLDGGCTERTDATILTLEYFGGSYALQVDELLGQRQVVIKPLGNQFSHHPGLAGSAIMGDGTVALILDPAHLIDQTVQV